MAKYYYEKYSLKTGKVLSQKSAPGVDLLMIENGKLSKKLARSYEVDGRYWFRTTNNLPDLSVNKNAATGLYHTQAYRPNMTLYTLYLGDSDGFAQYKYDVLEYIDGQVKGSLIEIIAAEDGAYPNDGISGSYWYVKKGLANAEPTITLDTTDNRTLYENDTITISGNAKDINNGDVVTVRYSINGASSRAITTAISDGADVLFNKILKFNNSKIFDGEVEVLSGLIKDTDYILKVWAEDDKGGKSTEEVITFTVIPVRPPQITLDTNKIINDLISSDVISIEGNVILLDGGTATVGYKVGEVFYETDVNFTDVGGDFTFNIPISVFIDDENLLSVIVTDGYSSTDEKIVNVTKSSDESLVSSLTARYKLIPLNSNVGGIMLWVEKSSLNSIVSVDISITNLGEPENFVPMDFSTTSPTFEGNIEDEFIYQIPGGLLLDNVIVRVAISGEDKEDDPKIVKISGVLI